MRIFGKRGPVPGYFVLRDGEGGGGNGGGEGGGNGGGQGGGGAGNGNAGGGGTGDGGGGGGNPPAHWAAAAGLPADLHGHEFVKGSKDLADFVKQSVNAQGMLGRKGVLVPTDWNNAEQVDKFYADLGRPKAHTEYQLKGPGKGADGKDRQYSESDKKFVDGMLPALHKAGLSQRQVEQIEGAWNESMTQLDGVFSKFAADSGKALDAKWGAEKPKMIAAAERFGRAAWGEQFDNMRKIPLAGGGFLLDHPMVLDAFAQAGLAMGEDGGEGGGRGGSGSSDPFSSLEAANKYVDDLYAAAEADPKHWLNHPEDASHAENRAHLHKVQRYAAQQKRRAKD